jgi:hypothetical protein
LEIRLHLDRSLKKTLEELFVLSAQAPALGLDNDRLAVDGLAIFRIAKEFSLTQPIDESCMVDGEDVARMVRFVIWLIGYGGEIAFNPSNERNQRLCHFMAQVLLQAQAQNSGFESLLKSYGIDRQLEPKSAKSTPRRSSGLQVARTDRTHQMQIRIGAQGTAEVASLTTESIWTADGWKRP